MVFLLKMLCDLFCAHSTGKARFATLLADWYQAAGTVSVESMSTSETSQLWNKLIAGFEDSVGKSDRNVVVSAVAAASYTFLKTR